MLSRATTEPLLPIEPWRTVRDAIKGLPVPLENTEHPDVANHRLVPGARAYEGHTGSFIDWPSKTLKAGVHGVPGGENTIAFGDGSIRYMTAREAARIQTFPDTWRFRGAWTEAMRQLGNAVPVCMASVVARSVAEKLQRPAKLPERPRCPGPRAPAPTGPVSTETPAGTRSSGNIAGR